jgi:hypothetical protein
MNLIAKPIIKNQYWVVTDSNNKKVGNVESQGTGFDVKIGNNLEHYDNTTQIEKFKKIEFEKPKKITKSGEPPFAVFPTGKNKVFNSMLDIKRKLHLFTTKPKSKCFQVAGWFAVKQTHEFTSVFCPKYIFIQRYPYHGPFSTEEEVKSIINSI